MCHSMQARKDWLANFLKRHPDLSIRQAEAISLARATGFNRALVGRFFDLSKQVLLEYIPPAKIYNADENGVSSVQKPGRVLAQKDVNRLAKLLAQNAVKRFILCCVL